MKIIETESDARSIIEGMEDFKVNTPSGLSVGIPCVGTMVVSRYLVVANTYNPNHVPRDKMELLCESIKDNGFCFPVVTIWDDDVGRFIVIDGFHRSMAAGPEWLDLPCLPVVVLKHDISKRMIATHQFNKARGVHQVDLDAEIVRALIEQGMSETDIAVKLGLEEDAVHRYKQITGIAELFKNAEWSMAWEMGEP